MLWHGVLMAWTIVETQNAKYVLLFSLHFLQTERSPLDFDALVLETGWRDASGAAGVSQDRQYKELARQAAEGGKPIWFAVPASSEYSRQRKKLGSIGLAALSVAGGATGGTAIAAAGLSGKKLTRRQFIALHAATLGLMASPLAYLFHYPVYAHRRRIKHELVWKSLTKVQRFLSGKGFLEIRDAITAENAESFIAPQLRETLARKPVIAISMGSAHYGIRDFLEHPQARQRVIAENNLEKYVQRRSLSILRFEIRKDGTIRGVKKFPFRYGQYKSAPPVEIPTEMPSRREFFSRFLRRK